MTEGLPFVGGVPEVRVVSVGVVLVMGVESSESTTILACLLLMKLHQKISFLNLHSSVDSICI